MKILVIGGTNFFGRDIVELALDAGHAVTLFSRGNQRPPFWDRIEHIRGDRQDRDAFRRALSGRAFDVVIDNIAWDADDVSHALATLQGNVGHYILTSSVAVYLGADRFAMPLREAETDLASTNRHLANFPAPTPDGFIDYARGKMAAERTLLAQDQVPYTIIRPPNVTGAEDPTGRCQFYLQRLLDGGPLILTNGGIQLTQPVYRRDLARGYLAALDNPRAINQIYHFAQDKTVRLVEWVNLLAEQLNVRPDLVAIPADVLSKSRFQYAEAWNYTGTLILDTAKAQAELGFAPTPIETWTEEIVQWYRNAQEGGNSPDDTNRQAEIDFAQRYTRAVEHLS